MEQELMFLSEPVTEEEDAPTPVMEKEYTPVGEYKMIIKGFYFKRLGEFPTLQVALGHTGENAMMFKGARMTIFAKTKGDEKKYPNKLYSLATACGVDGNGLRFGASGETDKYDNILAFIQDGDGEIVTDSFVGKSVVAVFTEKTNDYGSTVRVSYVKKVEEEEEDISF